MKKSYNITITGSAPRAQDYSDKGYDIQFKNEDVHFWFKGRNRIIRHVVDEIYPTPDTKSFLEVGCGTGYVLRELEKMRLQVTGLDMNLNGLKIASKRVKAPLICGLFEKVAFPKKFDAIGAFDVIEHINNETAFLKKCRARLKPGGHIFITVPAYKFLWSQIDDVGGHKRRYTKHYLEKILTNAGFSVRKISYFGMFILLPQFISRLMLDWKRTSKFDNDQIRKDSLILPPKTINDIFLESFYIEGRLMSWFSLPFGTSIIAAAQKNS